MKKAKLVAFCDIDEERCKLATHLAENINKIEGLSHFKNDYVKHAYYAFGFSYDESTIGISRNMFCKALTAEGIPCGSGYVKPLYLSPLYLDKRAFAFKHYTGKTKYEKGICPVAESLHENEVVTITDCRPPATIEDMDDIIEAIHKILENKHELMG